ncbi:MAG: HEAT repeat domain-containing protein [Acidobacteriota bacterium]
MHSKALIQQLRSSETQERQRAVEKLGGLQAVDAVKPLIRRLRDRNDRVQVAAARALGQIGDARAVRPLLRSLRGKTYGLTDGDGSPQQYFRIVASAACALARIGTPEAIDALLAKDNPLDVEGTAAAIFGLGYSDDPRALPALLAALSNAAFFVRDRAAGALGRLGDPSAVEPLIYRLQDPTWTVRVAAAEALGAVGDPRAVAPLQAIFEKAEKYVPISAGSLPVGMVRVSLRTKAARSLASIATPQALQVLEHAFSSAPSESQKVAAIAFAYRKDPRVLPVLAEALEIRSLQEETIGALSYLGDPRAEPLLEAVVADGANWSHVVTAARQALEQMRKNAMRVGEDP